MSFEYKIIKPRDTFREANSKIPNEWKRRFSFEMDVDAAKAIGEGLSKMIQSFERNTSMIGKEADKYAYVKQLREEILELARATRKLELA